MTLTPANIVWFNPIIDPEVIIDRCGEFNNVPLLGHVGESAITQLLPDASLDTL